MSAPDPRTTEFVFSRLVINPTNLAAAYPYGGTELGMAKEIDFRPNTRQGRVTGQEFGGETIEVIYSRQRAVLGALMRGGDDDAIATLFREVTTSTASGQARVEYPGTQRAGELGSDDSVKLLLVPRDVESYRALLFYRAIPLVDEAARLRFSLKNELMTPALFEGIRDASDRVYAWGRLEDLTL